VSPSTSSRKSAKRSAKPSSKQPAAHPAKSSAKQHGKQPAKALAARPPLKNAPLPPEKPKPKPKSPYDRKELHQFRLSLLGLRSHRIGDKESREQEALKAAGQDVSVDHMADFGTDNYEQEFTLGILEQDVETLRDIHDALGRIKDGSFGLCEECLKPIARARLRALPYARLCVDCKTKEE
jgi:DnaK suppressor protein